MKTIFRKWTAVLAVIGWAGAANAGIIYDNGGPSAGDSGNETTQWVQADDFNIAAGGSVTGAGVYIASILGNLGAWDGTLEYFIFADAGATPGAPIVTGNGVGVATSDTGLLWCCSGNAWLFEFNFESAFAATAGTDYWLGVHLSGDYDRDELYWVSQSGVSGNAAESQGGTFNNWSGGRLERAFFLTDGAMNPVPAPASLLLMILGLASLGWSRRQKA